MLATLLAILASSSLIGIDLGTEYTRAAVLRSGRSIEIVLNEHSKRKTPTMVSFDSTSNLTVENVRNIDCRTGDGVFPIVHRNRSMVIHGFTEIIGKTSSPELQSHLSSRLYEFNMTDDLVNGIQPHIPLALIFADIVRNAEQQLQEDNIKDAVIAVPAFFTNAQRSKISTAAQLAGLHLLKIIDEKSALSFVYALEKTSFFSKEAHTVAIVDFGSSFLTISAMKFSTKIVTQKDRSPKQIPEAEELGYAWSDEVGGLDFDIAIAKHLQSKYSLPSITTTLLDDAQKVKHAITLGNVANVSIESVDQRVIMTREEFCKICAPLFQKIKEVCRGLNMSFDSVEFVGAATRIYSFQEEVSAILGPASRSLNSDEAIVMGAAYIAAASSKSFKILEIIHKPTCAHTIDLVVGNRKIPIIGEHSSVLKARTARIDAGNETNIRLEYSSKLPIGMSPLIGEWDVSEFTGEKSSRLALTFSFDDRMILKLARAVHFTKSDDGVNQKEVTLKRTIKPLRLTKDEKSKGQLLISAIEANIIRMGKISESRSTFESLIFEVRDAIKMDPIWINVTSDSEKKQINTSIIDSINWLRGNIQDENAFKARYTAFDDLIKNVKFKVNEYRLRGQGIADLKSLIEEVEDAMKNKWPAKKLTPAKVQKKSLKTNLKVTKEWLASSIEKQSQLQPWEDPALLTSDLEIRTRKLSDQFHALEESMLSAKARGKSDSGEL